MRLTLNLEKKYAYAIIGFLALILGIFIVNAAYSSPTPNPGHTGESILVKVGSSETTLQTAINNGLFEQDSFIVKTGSLNDGDTVPFPNPFTKEDCEVIVSFKLSNEIHIGGSGTERLYAYYDWDQTVYTGTVKNSGAITNCPSYIANKNFGECSPGGEVNYIILCKEGGF